MNHRDTEARKKRAAAAPLAGRGRRLRLRISSFSLSASLCLCGLLYLMNVRTACAQAEINAANLTDEHVRKAIDALVDALYSKKAGERVWEPEKPPPGDSTRQGGGYTALVTLAMLAAGQTYQDPRLRDAIDFLERFSMDGTYAVSVRTSVWSRLPPKFRDRLEADTQWLLAGFSETIGGWDYEQNPRAKRKDNSIRQFGALALWEAAKRGAKIEPRYWQRLEDAFLDMQLADGGWNYTGEGPATGSMTCAGLATLFITQDLLHAQESVKVGNDKVGRHAEAIDKGLKWMDEHFSATENPGKNTWIYYYLYGVERVGLASGYKTFGGKDWFREGAAEIIKRLLKWDDKTKKFAVNDNAFGSGRGSRIRIDDFAFGLMFLSRGRVPVAVNKLQFDGEGEGSGGSGAWNNRPRDVANLVAYLREESESDLAWQIVKMSDGPERWLDAPMLYVASHQQLPFMKNLEFDVNEWVKQAKDFIRQRAAGELPMDAKPPERPQIAELDALKRYLDLGGTIIALAEGGGRPFADSVEKAGLLMYPQYEWKDLPETHWAYTIHTQQKTRRPPLKSLSNGVRDLIILSPSGDLPAALQVNDTTKKAQDFATLANLYFYASELNRSRPRLEQHAAFAEGEAGGGGDGGGDGDVLVVRAVHEGNWKPEPRALDVFAAWLRDSRSINIVIADQPLAKIGELDPKPTLVIVSGIDKIALSETQKAAIKTYVEAGGVILFETPGGSKVAQFSPAAEQACADLLQRPVESIARTRVITGERIEGAVDCTKVEWRPYALQVFGSRDAAPRLQGISLNAGGQPQLVFSREDISNGLLNQPCWGVVGYSSKSARDLLANILQHAMAGAE